MSFLRVLRVLGSSGGCVWSGKTELDTGILSEGREFAGCYPAATIEKNRLVVWFRCLR